MPGSGSGDAFGCTASFQLSDVVLPLDSTRRHNAAGLMLSAILHTPNDVEMLSRSGQAQHVRNGSLHLRHQRCCFGDVRQTAAHRRDGMAARCRGC
jgi:hypothetical protein